MVDHLDLPLALIGRNGAGKTNVLHAIAWAAKGGVIDSQLPMYEAEGDVVLHLEVLGNRYTYAVRRTLDRAHPGQGVHVEEHLIRQSGREIAPLPVISRTDSTLLIEADGEMTIPPDVSAVRAVLGFFAGTPALKDEIQAIFSLLEGITYYPLMPTSPSHSPGFFWWKDYVEWKKSGKRTIATDEDLNLLLFEAWWNDRAKFDELQALLGPNSLGIVESVEIFQYTPSDVPNSGYLPVADTRPDKAEESLFGVFFRPHNGNARVRFRQLSMGTKRVIQLIAHLIMDRISVALIEQPEDALHPAMQRRVMGIIHTYSAAFQCVVTSHSPELFNSMSPAAIRLVAYEGQRTMVSSLSEEQIAHAREYLECEGSLAEFLELL